MLFLLDSKQITDNFWSSLEILWKGMLAIFIAIGLIYISIIIMNLFTKKPEQVKKFIRLVNLFSAILAFVTLMTIFLPILKISDVYYYTFEVIMGSPLEYSSRIIVFDFSFMMLLTYILINLVIAIGIVSFIKEKRFSIIIITSLSLLIGILLSCTKYLVVFNSSYTPIYTDITLELGGVIGAICMFIIVGINILKISLIIKNKNK